MDLSPSYPPFRMKAAEAAYYCGVSVSTFLRCVDSGVFPKGKTALGGRFWLRADLEAAMLDPKAKKHDFGQKI